MDEILSSWTLTWFVILNVVTLGLSGIYYLFEVMQKGE